MINIKIPLKNNELHIPTDLDLAVWESAYPHINVHQVLRYIAAWNHSNPSKRKTRRGINRHINQWLQQENNKVMAGVENATQTRLNVQDWTRKALGI